MLQQDQPDDYVVATGSRHSVKELVQEAFGHVGLDWQKYVGIDPALPPAGRSRSPDRRSGEGQARARLGAVGGLQGPRAHDGRRRPRAGRAASRSPKGPSRRAERAGLLAASMRVGLVIVTYNAEACVRRALDAVAAQTRPPDRVVILDNASS